MNYMKDLSPELQKIAVEELNEDPTTTVNHIEHIREWLKKQPHINPRTDDQIILRFLRGCKFSLQKTKDKFEMYYTCRGLIPEWFSNRDPLDPKIKQILELGEFLPLNTCDKKGRRIIIIRPGIHDPASTSMDEVFKVSQMILDVLVEEDISSSVAGFVHIMDIKALSPANIFQMTPTLMKKSMTVFQDAHPQRPKAFHHLNTSPVFDSVFNILKNFMKEKLRKRLHFHGSDIESLHQHVPKDALPIEYGGTESCMEDLTKQWLDKVTERRSWFLDDEKYKADESKRQGEMKSRVDLFGIEGSFKKLNVD